MKTINGIFEGGGVKGASLAGAVAMAEEMGFAFDYVGGTSAGAIVASLLAAGYTGAELTDIVRHIDYGKFLDKDRMDRVPFVGSALSVLFERGLYEGAFFERWIAGLLAAKGVRTFNDLVWDPNTDDVALRYRLHVVASDLTTGEMVVFPDDAAAYGIDPDDMEVAAAVRMSMSIPFFFEPVSLAGHTVVDGGLLSNYPVWLFDADPECPAPTVGFKMVDPDESDRRRTDGPINMLKALFGAMMENFDRAYIKDAQFARTVPVPIPQGIHTTDFDIDPDRVEALISSGMDAAHTFLSAWDFDAYKAVYAGKKASRTERVKAAA